MFQFSANLRVRDALAWVSAEHKVLAHRVRPTLIVVVQGKPFVQLMSAHITFNLHKARIRKPILFSSMRMAMVSRTDYSLLQRLRKVAFGFVETKAWHPTRAQNDSDVWPKHKGVD